MMEEGLKSDLTTERVNELYDDATEYLKTRQGSFIFEDPKLLHHNNWTIATWSKYISQSRITKRGTDSDKTFLPIENRFNRPHPVGRKRNRRHANIDG
jgi:hypothetical protein